LSLVAAVGLGRVGEVEVEIETEGAVGFLTGDEVVF
jgi:hypothetical protein